MKPSDRPKLLAIGFEPAALAAALPVLEACEQITLGDVAELETVAATAGERPVVLIELREGQPAVEELGAALKLRLPRAELVAVTASRRLFHRGRVAAAGFSDVFLLPLEDAFLARGLAAAIKKASGGQTPVFRSIRLADLAIGGAVPCRLYVFLSVNAKFVQYLDTGSVLTADHLERLKIRGLNALSVALEDLPAFYAAATALALAHDKAARMGMSERRHRFEDGVREQFAALYRGADSPDETASAELGASLFKLVRGCLLELPRHTLGELLRSAVGQLPDGYSRALNTATYAAIFSMACEVGNAGEAATAGLMHCLGLKPLSAHPAPELLAVVAAAELFDEVTCAVPGQVAKTPAELTTAFRTAALEKIQGALDPELIEKISALLTK